MIQTHRSIQYLTLLAGTLIFAGCSQSPYLGTEYVEGIVTVGGSPIEGANVTFIPAESAQGITGIGVTDASGKYQLTTVSSRDGLKPKHGAGVVAGVYNVTVEKVEIPADIQAKLNAGVKVPYDPSKMNYAVPRKYSSPDQSGLQVEVVSGSNTIPFDL